MAFVVPTPASWVVAEALAINEAMVEALPASSVVMGALGAMVAQEAEGTAIRNAEG